ncbi:hypothetical protein B296_00010707, partial [Ensete ventricosum]
LRPSSATSVHQGGRLGVTKGRGQRPDPILWKVGEELEGPYRVVDVVREWIYTLATTEGRMLPIT